LFSPRFRGLLLMLFTHEVVRPPPDPESLRYGLIGGVRH